jgi:ABC-2 type transport system ATP-binding protein
VTHPLEFHEISKQYGKLLALDRLSLTVGPGEIVGFVGPNGAGKTTAIHLAMGFLHSTSGNGHMLGHSFGDPASRLRLGFLPDAPTVFTGGADAAIVLAARLNNVQDPPLRQRTQELISTLGLPSTGRNARQFSRGMQQRLGLAQALVNDPQLLILDEPTSALDPPGVLEVRAILRQARAAGKSVFFSSHQLSEVEQICDRVAFLHEGRLLRCGNLDELMSTSGTTEILIRGIDSSSTAVQPFTSFLAAPDRDSNLFRLILPTGLARPAIEAAWSAGGELVHSRPMRKTLEELFIEWTADTSSPSPVASETRR